MPRYLALMFVVAACMLSGVCVSYAQATKQLEKRTKNLQNSEKKSWEQVDQINKESDRTKSRYQQGREAGGLNKHKKGYDVTKHGIVPRERDYKKVEKPKKTEPKKK